MPMYLDMMDFPVDIVNRPMRVVSLVPSLSLLFSDLELGDRLVGVTKFCVHPKELRETRTVVGGTKLLRLDDIRQLKPDLIVANKEENNKSDVELLQSEFPVWISSIDTVDDALSAISILGDILKTQDKAKEILDEINHRRTVYKSSYSNSTERIAYVIWKKPFMAAGSSTFINHMLLEGGWINAFEQHERYPAFTLEGLEAMKPDWLFLSSEPYPFQEKHEKLFENVMPKERVRIVDGEMFSWYGSRIRDSFAYFEELRHDMQISAV